MSYPRKIHTLIVEDEAGPISNYEDIFGRLAQKYDLVEPRIVGSVEDAKAILQSPTIIHLLILDLGLPIDTRGTAMTGVDAGVSLLNLACQRDAYPIPAVLLISARLNLVNITEFNSRLSDHFWQGALVNKGVDEHESIERAIIGINRYCDVGIHIRDRDGLLCPTLSPREEDILRRCVLRNSNKTLPIGSSR